MAAGNPCAEKNNDDYESFVLAYLGGQVRWLDYRVISNDKVQTCKEQFQNELELLAQNEDITKAEIMQAEKDKISQAALHKIYMLEAFTLFDVLMTEDIFLPKISRMEGLNDLQDNLKKDLTGIVNTLRTELTAKCELINVDESEFRERLITLYQKAQEQSLSLIKGLKRSRKILFNKELMCSLPPRIEFIGDMPPTDMGHTERKLRNFRLEVNNVKEDLEALETNVQSAALALIDRFEDNYSAMMTANIELLAEFFQKAINFANRFHDSLKDTAVAAVTLHLDSQGNGDNEDEDGDGGTAGSMILDNSQGLEDMDEDVLGGGDSYISLLSNVDSMMEVVNASHEKHESIILNKDEAVRRSIREKLQTTIANVKTQEFDRSRLFLKDIVNTTNELITSAEDAFEVLKAKLDRY
jgi:hypothetical protein